MLDMFTVQTWYAAGQLLTALSNPLQRSDNPTPNLDTPLVEETRRWLGIVVDTEDGEDTMHIVSLHACAMFAGYYYRLRTAVEDRTQTTPEKTAILAYTANMPLPPNCKLSTRMFVYKYNWMFGRCSMIHTARDDSAPW